MNLNRSLFGALAALALPSLALAWGETGHKVVNELALASLPADFPGWARTPESQARIVFLANEPDRWRDSADHMFLHSTASDHEFNLEEIPDAGMDLATLSPYRYEFVVQFEAAREAHLANFRPIDPKYNGSHNAQLPGFLPWAIAEDYGRLQVEFSYLKVYEKFGTPAEVAQARQNILYTMGVMGHFVGDGSQPLHVTKYYYGWTGPNPGHFVNKPGWHAWIDSGFIDKAGITAAEILPRVRTAEPLDVQPRPDERDPVFVQVLDYLCETNKLVVPLYRLERDGPLRMNGPPTAEGRAFIDDQLLRAGQMLGSVWLTAWRHAGPDRYLQSQLLRRSLRESRASSPAAR